MTDTYEFLKAQKDAILAKQEAERDEWLTAALEDIAMYKQQIAELVNLLEVVVETYPLGRVADAARAAIEKAIASSEGALQALAVQPKQEPVAWMHRSNDMHFMKEKPLGEIEFLFVPLYTHPKPKEETVQKPVAWEYRYKESNPHTVNYGKWGEWERLVPRNALETVEGRVAEMNQYIATGYSYEVRALYDSPLVQTGRDEALAVQPKQEPVQFDVTIDDNKAKLLWDMLGEDREDLCDVRLLAGFGHSGYGLYVASADYPEEGADLLATITAPQPQREW